jgi:hypothetical protein
VGAAKAPNEFMKQLLAIEVHRDITADDTVVCSRAWSPPRHGLQSASAWTTVPEVHTANALKRVVTWD